jgi:hypothetical protein
MFNGSTGIGAANGLGSFGLGPGGAGVGLGLGFGAGAAPSNLALGFGAGALGGNGLGTFGLGGIGGGFTGSLNMATGLGAERHALLHGSIPTSVPVTDAEGEPLNLDARAQTRTALVQRAQLALAAAKFDKSETRAIAEAALKTWTVAASAAAEADYVAAALDRLRADTDSTPAGALASLADVADSAAANARELAESASRGIEAALWRDGVEFASLGRADQAQRKVVAAGNLHVPRALFAAALNETLEGLCSGGARRTNGRFNRWRDRDDSGHSDRDRDGDRDHDRDRGHADRGRDRDRGGGDDGRSSRRGTDRDGPDRGSGSGSSGGSGNSSGGSSAGGGSGDRAAART